MFVLSRIRMGNKQVKTKQKHCTVHLHRKSHNRENLPEFLLEFTKTLFQDLLDVDMVVITITSYAQRLVDADMALLFWPIKHTGEMYVRLTDAARRNSGEIDSTVFCSQTSTPNELRVIGVLQMINKRSGSFNRSDERAFKKFAVYCGLALSHTEIYEKMRRSEQKYKVALDILSRHCQSTSDELSALLHNTTAVDLRLITRHSFSPWSVSNDDKPVLCVYMLQMLFSNTKYNIEDLMRFILTIRKSYTEVIYHNWTHAFSVALSMFAVIETAKHNFTSIERVSLFVTCLCHDLDNRVKTNKYLEESMSPLAVIYSTSSIEYRHFNQTVTILQIEGHNIFQHLTSDQYKVVLSDIKRWIVDTDLATFIKRKTALQTIHSTVGFEWNTTYHKNALISILMTGCDLCSMYKPWDVHQVQTNAIMDEWMQRGSSERLWGLLPKKTVFRSEEIKFPSLEVEFIQDICLPCYHLLAIVMPETKPMLEGCLANLKSWKKLAEDGTFKRDTPV